MSTFETHTIDSAPENSKPLLEGIQNTYGFIPNLFAGMAESPVILEGYLQLTNIINKGTLTETERQIVFMTNNRLNGCQYCMAAHTTISQMSGVDSEVIDALRNNTPINDDKLEALRIFAEIMNESRGWPTESQLNAFFKAGYTKESLLELIVATSLKVMSNYTNHVAQTSLDSAFTSNSWSKEKA